MEPVRLTDEEAEALTKGIREFNEGFYFEAHDTLEEAWHGIRGPHRAFFHGLIQMATGLYHLTGDNPKGARSQLTAGLRKLSPLQPEFLGVDIGGLLQEMQEILGSIGSVRGSGRLPFSRLPCISLKKGHDGR